MFLVSFIQSEIVINEVNIADPQNFAKIEFIELKSTDGDEIALRGYKIIGLNCQTSSGSIDLIVTLWNDRTKNGLYTIGGTEITNADLKVPSDYIKFKNSFNDKVQQTIKSFFAKGDLRAIGLLHDKEKLNSFKDFTLSKKTPSLKINDEIVEQLKKYLIDLVVLYEKCKLFERINDEFTLKKYILREFPSNFGKTLNRCAIETNGFLAEKFKLGDPTPGQPNDCKGARFLLEDFIPVNVLSAYADDCDNFEEASSSNQNTCSTSIQPELEQAIREANEYSTRDRCTSLLLYPDGSNTALTVEQENSRKRHFSVDKDYSEELEWRTAKHFKQEWIKYLHISQI